MRRSAVHLVLLATSSLAVARARADVEVAGPQRQPASAQRTIHVTGEGRVAVAPDIAVVTVAATALDPSLAKATRDVNDAARRVRDVLLKSGIAPRDLQTARYDVQVERTAEKPGAAPRIAGYRVSNALTAKIRDLSQVGAVLDRVVSAGANQVEGLSFVKEDTTGDTSRALGMAVRAARVKAEEIARAAGVRLGEILEVSETGRGRPGPLAVRAMAMGPEVPVEPGDIEIVSRLDLVFALQ